jgi:hypothetical protein
MFNAIYDTAAIVPNFLGVQTTTCKIKANFIHLGDQRPLTNQKIVVLSNNLGIKKVIGTFTTGNPTTGAKPGEITFDHTFVKYPFQSSQTLIFQVFEEALGSKSNCINPADENLVFTSIQTIPIGAQHVKDVEVDLYEFVKGFPRYKVPADSKNMPQHWDLVDYYRIVSAAAGGKITKAYMDFIELFYGPLSTDQIKKITKVEKPDVKLCEETTLDIIMNGIYPDLRKIGRNKYFSEINFDGLELKNENDLPNAQLFAYKDKNDKLHIEKITLQYRGGELKTYTHEDKDFKSILFIYNSLALTKGSCQKHLGMHFKMEEFAVGVGHTINLNPTANLLKPILRGVLQINQQALDIIIKALKQSGLTENGVWKDLEKEVETNCWSTFKLPEKICEAHGLADASKLFFEITNDIVEMFFKENIEGILKHWYEIKDMSDVFVENSLPCKDQTETEGREFFEGAYRSFKPITKTAINPSQTEINNLKEYCKYVIYQATWGHWTLHISENIGLNPDIARFAINNVTLEELSEYLEKQISLGQTLTKFEDGTIVDNPNGDIYPPFVDRLKREDVVKYFAKCGFNSKKILYGTII